MSSHLLRGTHPGRGADSTVGLRLLIPRATARVGQRTGRSAVLASAPGGGRAPRGGGASICRHAAGTGPAAALRQRHSRSFWRRPPYTDTPRAHGTHARSRPCGASLKASYGIAFLKYYAGHSANGPAFSPRGQPTGVVPLVHWAPLALQSPAPSGVTRGAIVLLVRTPHKALEPVP